MTRSAPSVTKVAEVGTQRFICGHAARFPYFPYLASGTVYEPQNEGNCDGLTAKAPNLVIPSDDADFQYDEMGNLTSANNNDARVTREYFPNGALKHETQAIGLLDETQPLNDRFNTHIYRMGYLYDLNGRRLARTDTLPNCASCTQTYHYDPTSGFLDSGTDAGAGHPTATYGFQYDSVGRVNFRSVNNAQSTISQHFDPDGRKDARTVIGAGNTVYNETMYYDKSGRNITTSMSSSLSSLSSLGATQVYSGLGALAYYNAITSGGAFIEDEYQTDGLDNRISDRRWFENHQTNHVYRYTREKLDGVDQVTPWASGDPMPPTPFVNGDTSETDYGGAGSVEYTFRAAFTFTEQGPIADPTRDEWNWIAYGADERLRLSQHSVMTTSGARTATTDYRYDALGRRVVVRTRWANCSNESPPLCLEMIEHTAWDGDQVLMERHLGLSEAPATGNFYGSVRYTQAGGIDEPLIVWKDDVGGWVPERSWRGVYEHGTPVDGTSNGVTWPGQSLDVITRTKSRREKEPSSTRSLVWVPRAGKAAGAKWPQSLWVERPSEWLLARVKPLG